MDNNNNNNNNKSYINLLKEYENHQAETAAKEQCMKELSSDMNALEQQAVIMEQQMDALQQQMEAMEQHINTMKKKQGSSNMDVVQQQIVIMKQQMEAVKQQREAMKQQINTMKKEHESKRKQLEEEKEKGRVLKKQLEAVAYPKTKTSAAKIKGKEVIVLEDTDDEEDDKKPAAIPTTSTFLSQQKCKENKTAISSSFNNGVIDLTDDSVDINNAKEAMKSKVRKGEEKEEEEENPTDSCKIAKRKFSQVDSDAEQSYPSNDDNDDGGGDDDDSDEDYIDDDTNNNHCHNSNSPKKLKISTPTSGASCRTSKMSQNMKKLVPKPTPITTVPKKPTIPITPDPPVTSTALSSHNSHCRALERSVGKTRAQLNDTKNISKFMGTCKFGQKVVCAKGNKVYAIVLNDAWNQLAKYENDKQDWYVGEGPKRKEYAEMVGRVTQPIPMFHAPKKTERNTSKIYYVGHFKVESAEFFEEPEQIKVNSIVSEKERQARITFKFDKFDRNVADIIAGN